MIPIKWWVPMYEVDPGAIAQANNLASLPFARDHIAIMPDCHQGYGMPIGAILKTEGVVVPNAVGVDIGCGVTAVPLIGITELTRTDLREISDRIKSTIPLGMTSHTKPQVDLKYFYDAFLNENYITIPDKFKEDPTRFLNQLGTLGGGNHFIEIQENMDLYSKYKYWLMIHSGSRNLGHTIASHWNTVAKEHNTSNTTTSVPPSWDLAGIPMSNELGEQYYQDSLFCAHYAALNRRIMRKAVFDIVYDVTCNAKPDAVKDGMFTIDVAHNYVTKLPDNMLLHRKGATAAEYGEFGVIPGSQGTSSYIVLGLGNKDSFCSSSHGAGRTMSRSKAKSKLSLTEEQSKLNNLGVVHDLSSINKIDEAPGAYKDIKKVMDNQKDLVDIKYELRPIMVVKG